MKWKIYQDTRNFSKTRDIILYLYATEPVPMTQPPNVAQAIENISLSLLKSYTYSRGGG